MRRKDKKGRKIEIIKLNNKVAFQTEMGVELLLKEEACRCGTKYLSVFGTGKAVLLEQLEEKRQGLDAIITKYTGETGFTYSVKALEQTLVIPITSEEHLDLLKRTGFDSVV